MGGADPTEMARVAPRNSCSAQPPEIAGRPQGVPHEVWHLNWGGVGDSAGVLRRDSKGAVYDIERPKSDTKDLGLGARVDTMRALAGQTDRSAKANAAASTLRVREPGYWSRPFN